MDTQVVICRAMITGALRSISAKPNDNLILTVHPDNCNVDYPYVLRLEVPGGRWCQRSVRTPKRNIGGKSNGTTRQNIRLVPGL